MSPPALLPCFLAGLLLPLLLWLLWLARAPPVPLRVQPAARPTAACRLVLACPSLPCLSEFWENYSGPRFVGANRYVWAAASVALALAAVYSSYVERGLLQ